MDVLRSISAYASSGDCHEMQNYPILYCLIYVCCCTGCDKVVSIKSALKYSVDIDGISIIVHSPVSTETNVAWYVQDNSTIDTVLVSLHEYCPL